MPDYKETLMAEELRSKLKVTNVEEYDIFTPASNNDVKISHCDGDGMSLSGENDKTGDNGNLFDKIAPGVPAYDDAKAGKIHMAASGDYDLPSKAAEVTGEMSSFCDQPEPLRNYQKQGEKCVEELFSKEQFLSLGKTLEESISDIRMRFQTRYEQVREEMQTAVKTIVLQEMKKVLQTTQQLRDQVLSLRDLAKNQERTIARKDQVIDDLMTDLKRVNQNTEAALENFREKNERFLLTFVDRLANQHLLHRVFCAWKSTLEGSWKNRFMHKLKDEARAECERLTKEYQTKTQQLEDELKLARTEMKNVRATQAEENTTLRMALMRGVCALNMETLSLFHKESRGRQNGNMYTDEGNPCASTDFRRPASEGWFPGDAERYYHDALSQLLGRQNGNNAFTSLTPIPCAETQKQNPHPPGLPEPNEAWPREMPPSYVYPFEAEQGRTTNDPSSQFMQKAQDRYNHETECKVSSPHLGTGYTNTLDRFHSNTAFWLNENHAMFTDRPGSRCPDPEENCVMELPVNYSIPLSDLTKSGPEFQCDSSFGKSDSTGVATEAIRKRLPIRSLTTKTSTAHTVQHGVPAGPTTKSSSVVASVHVHRHPPLTQAISKAQLGAKVKSWSTSQPIPTNLNSICRNYPIATSQFHG
ncbi:hypothetical protein EG68_07874 [Paragonimus skrjabini miyazakii]|uniref:Centrosomal protein POC5 n=1 Tax=Paragonimus skrjabini miyazakii TaxID=59628 RepID=A0A8S9YCD9_9TREM|nr:hypothetical protein EG68_07874 [Paragonimus skrjabini miyazakii]